MRYHVTGAGRTFEVVVEPDRIEVDGDPVDVDLGAVDGGSMYSLLVDGRSHRLLARRGGRGVWEMYVGGTRVELEAVDERTRTIREMTAATGGPAGPRPVRAPMPGLVVKVEVSRGEEVTEGQGLLIVEAMKMENELRAEADGIVAAVHVTEGDAVEKDQLLVEFELSEEV